ncbi:MAG: fused MFS/spermidine synthase [Anaerolineae bacterium]|nr:fused MFS/spermidine synthase [Anaerolineae bacterium]
MAVDERRLSPGILLAAAFVAGIVSFGIEFATSRMIGAVLGTADMVWAVVITLMLVYFSAGYALGGRWADRSPHTSTFVQLLAWAALATGLIPVLARPLLLRMAAAFALSNLDILVLGVVGGAVLLLFAVPVTLLGCVSPFVVRLALQDTGQAGAVAGRAYALSTLGNILGTFAPLILIPAVGTAWTYGVLALVLLLVALGLMTWLRPGLALRHAWMPVALVLVLGTLSGPVKPPPEGTTLLYEAETAYNYVQVVEVNTGVVVARQPPGTRFLLLNEGQGVHSVYHPEQLQTFATWDMFLAAPYFNPLDYRYTEIDRVAIIGLAAGTVAQQYTAVYGPVAIDGIEIDPGIVQAGREYFAMTMPNLNVIVQDGRYGLAQLEGQYDLVAIDAYRVPYIPWHLTTREFFAEVKNRLAPEGVVMINVGRAADDRRFVDAIAATMREVYPSVHAIDVPYSFNTMLVATRMPTSPANLMEHLAALPEDAHPLLGETLAIAFESIVPVADSEIIFRDDRAPVETLINAMIIEFILGENNLGQLEG